MFDIRLTGLEDEKRCEQLIGLMKKYRGSCDTVWLSTLGGWLERERHKKHAERLGKLAEMFRAAGINVSLQIHNTLGHGDFNVNPEKSKGLTELGDEPEHAVGPNGEYCHGSFCFYGENFRKYLHETVGYYAFIKPQTLWIDDDLRATNHQPAEFICYCDDCIERFNKNNGTSFTRDELVYEINYGDIKWRRKYMEQLRDGMREFTEIVASAITEKSPQTHIGIEYGRFWNYLDSNYNYLFEGAYKASGHTVKSRPGGGFYWDKNPMDMLFKAIQLNCSNSVLPDFVTDNYAEIENIPDVAFGKSHEGTCKEGTLDIAYGCNGLTFAAINRGQEGDEYDEKRFRWLKKYKPYWDRMLEQNKNTHFGGLTVYSSDNAYNKVLTPDDEPFLWAKLVGVWDTTYIKTGIPVSCDKEDVKVYLLYAEAVDYMTDEDIEEILTMPVVTSAAAVEKLIDRGYGNRIGCTVCGVDESARSGYEIFEQHSINGDFAGMKNSECYFIDFVLPKPKLINGAVEALGTYYRGADNKKLGTTTAIINTFSENKKAAAKWAVFGYNFGRDIVSSKKRDEILNAADYLCGNTLAAKIISPEQITVMPRVNKDGKTVSVSFMNCSIGRSDEFEVLVRNPQSEKFTYMNADNAETELPFEKTDNGYLVKLPSLGAWEPITLFC